MKALKQKIGHRIYHLRKRLGLTQKELGQELGLSGSTVSGCEIGDSHLSPEALIRLCELAGVTPTWVLIGSDEMNNTPPDIPHLTDDEQQLLNNYRLASKSERSALLVLAAAAAGNKK